MRRGGFRWWATSTTLTYATKVWDTYEQHQANAAVYMLMDVSGSMTTSKKYIAESFFFWLHYQTLSQG